MPKPMLSPAPDSINDVAIDALLDHIACYRLTVFAAIQRLPAFSAWRPQAIRELLKECQAQSLIAVAPLHHGFRYTYLDVLGAERRGLDQRRAGPLSEPAKLRAMAVLQFCCLSNSSCHRLSDEELSRSFPDVARPGLPSTYYFNPDGSGRLGLARVDAGGRGRWDRVVHSLRQDIRDHFRQPGFQRLIRAGRFEITLLTVLRQKARRVCQSLSSAPEAHCVPCRVVALPELLPLISFRR